MKPAVIARIIAARPRDIAEAAWIAGELSRVENIRDSLRMERAAIARLTEAFNREAGVIRGRIGKVQADCPHYSRTRHGDPAGGSDGWSECDICGAEV